jgi:glycosyltransferase involved in cell wall biosynthesis
MSEMDLPKVLIVNQPFNNHTGGAITLSNLFAGWDKDKIAVICYHYLLGNADTAICDTYYQLGFREHKFIFPFNILKRKHSSGLISIGRKEPGEVNKHKPGYRGKVIQKYFNPVLKYLGFYNSISRIELSDEFREWVDKFDPDIIYAQAPARESLVLVSLIQSYCQKPLIFHMMDDWIIADKGPLKNIERKKNEKEFKRIMDKANILMSVSDGMAEAYKTRYGKEFITFHNPIDVNFWKPYQKSRYKLNDPPTILYAGRVGLGIDSSLELIAKAVQQVNEALKLSLKFILQTKDKPSWASGYKYIEHRSFVAYEELPKVFSEADILVLPYDFSEQALRFIRYSMPTKATEYMITGTPIILFAPKETAIVDDAERYGWATVITENNVTSLVESITYLVKNEEARRKVGKHAIKFATENHGSENVRTRFRAALFSLVNQDK